MLARRKGRHPEVILKWSGARSQGRAQVAGATTRRHVL
jgi:hypothetical protein